MQESMRLLKWRILTLFCLSFIFCLAQSKNFIKVIFRPDRLMSEENFTISIYNSYNLWKPFTGILLNSTRLVYLNYATNERQVLALSNNIRIVHKADSANLTISGSFAYYDDLCIAGLYYVEKSQLFLLKLVITHPNRLGKLLLEWNHSDLQKRHNPVSFVNDIIKITCQLIASETKQHVSIYLPPKTILVHTDKSRTVINMQVLYIKLTRQIYKNSVNCSTANQTLQIIDKDILNFKLHDKYHNQEIHSSVFNFFLLLIIVTFMSQMIIACYLLTVKQTEIRVNRFMKRTFEAIESKIFIYSSGDSSSNI